MMNNRYWILLVAIALSWTLPACNKTDNKGKPLSKEEILREKIAKKDFILIVKDTPMTICKNDTFISIMDAEIQKHKIKDVEIKIKDITAHIQKNDVKCKRYIPKDKKDFVDPFCRESDIEAIIAEYDIPLDINLSDTNNSACLLSANHTFTLMH